MVSVFLLLCFIILLSGKTFAKSFTASSISTFSASVYSDTSRASFIASILSFTSD